MTTAVRWKFLLATLALLSPHVRTDAKHAAKIESLSMADDGWRPIVGTQRDSPFDEITHYRNPASKKSDPVKAEKPVPPPKIETTTTTTTIAHGIGSKKALSSNLNPVAKMPPYNSKPVFLLPMAPHPHPLHHRPMKYSHLMKVHHHAKPPPPSRHKPMRHQIPAFSTRDEVFVPAPSSNIGPYTFYSAGQPVIKTHRPAPPPPPAHIEFANHFPIPNSDDELYQIVRAPVHQYVIPKSPTPNEVHYTFQNPDEFNARHPPYKFETHKENKVKKASSKDGPRQEALIQKVHPFHVTTPQPNHVEVQVTKEKLKVFHNSIPSNYSPLDEFDYRLVKPTVAHQKQRPATYEVTEGKWNHETPVFQYHYATAPVKPRPIPTRVITEESKPFLPTPIKPDHVPPTLPTESEISTIYNQVKFNRQKVSEFSTPSPINFFDVKEVSTHFPILGPPEYQTISYPTRFHLDDEKNEKENEITTKQVMQDDESSSRPLRPRRPNRRRRPTSTTPEAEEVAVEVVDTATDSYEPQKTETSAEVTTQRIRRPSRYRSTIATTTTTTSSTMLPPEYETTTTRSKVRRPRPTTTTSEPPPFVVVPENHKAEYESLEEKFARLTTTTEKEFPANFESHFTAPFRGEAPITEKVEEQTHRPSKYYTNPPVRGGDEEEDPASVEEVSDEKEEEKILEDFRAKYNEAKKDPEGIHPEITINTPENELDFTTRHTYFSTKPQREEITTTEVVYTTTITAAPTTTTSTTTEPPKRVRGRPVKYDANNRPRFSVKEYRQRLTTSTTTTETPPPPSAKTQNDSMRIRFPNRSRRPITPTPTTTPAPPQDDDFDAAAPKSKFQPKEPRHPNLENATEKLRFSTVNTRIRPFGRYKSTTDASTTTTTQRVAIKSNIFGNLRRPTPISLKTRILNRQRANATTTKPEAAVTTLDNIADDANETDQTEIVETTIPYSVEESSEFDAKRVDDVDDDVTTQLADVQETKHDDYMQSQIVSELTSSAKNEYNKPGLFKNVQPNSRKVPSYFTLATDDPILPIEAFFPNLKDKQ